MFSLIVLLSFNRSLACDRKNCLFLNDEPCKVSPTFIDMNPVELKYYPFVISQNKCSGSFNILFPKIYLPKRDKRHKCSSI